MTSLCALKYASVLNPTMNSEMSVVVINARDCTNPDIVPYQFPTTNYPQTYTDSDLVNLGIRDSIIMIIVPPNLRVTFTQVINLTTTGIIKMYDINQTITRPDVFSNGVFYVYPYTASGTSNQYLTPIDKYHIASRESIVSKSKSFY